MRLGGLVENPRDPLRIGPAILVRGRSRPCPREPRLVNVGRLSEQKGQLLLIKAAAPLRDQGLDFELVIVGDGSMRGEIEQLVDRLGLRDCVRITGFLDNYGVLRELTAARALVLPSFAEGLPVVIMEALALGRPVISTYVAGIPELIEPGRQRLASPCRGLEPLVDAMAEALTADPAELERMGRAGAARVAERHNALTEATKLAVFFSNPDAIANQSSRSTFPPAGIASGKF